VPSPPSLGSRAWRPSLPLLLLRRLRWGSDFSGWVTKAVLASAPEASVYHCARLGGPGQTALATAFRERSHLGVRVHLPEGTNELVEWRGASRSELFEHVLATERRLLPEDHPSTAGSLNNLAKGEYGKAVRLHEEALAMRRRLLPEDLAPGTPRESAGCCTTSW
jgi:hypothetical protein